MIEVTGVRKSFGRVLALAGVSLRVEPGERVGFVGANGSGKTTLLRALLGLVRVEGRVTIGGRDVAREPHIALRSVAYIPQIAPPLDVPVGELVRAHAEMRGMSPEATHARAARLGLDLGKSRAKRFRDLSGGTKQKLLAAMALATEAPILVCDEPTANLDGDARAAFFEQLAERPSGGVVVLSSHRIEEVQKLVGRVVEMREGSIVSDVPVSEILRDVRGFRVEVSLRERAASAEAFLRERGFSSCGPRRLAAHVAQADKVDIVARLFREHGDGVDDMSVAALDDMMVMR